MPVTINTPPKAEPERLNRLVERVNAGEIKIPKFQRGFVWQRPAVLELLESILQGYPIGSLLFWRTEQKLKSERDIQGFALPPTPDKYPTNYVLDGQQRLTTIYGVLSYKSSTEQPHILSVIYDLRKKELRHRQPTDGQWCLPLNVMFDFARFNQFQQSLTSLSDGDELNAEALRVNETFREYQVPVVTLTERTLDEVCPIFERINSTGTKLTIYDLMVAATFSEDFDLDDEVQALAQSLASKNFNINGNSVLRTLSALRGKSVKKKAILALREVPRSELRENLKTTRKALEKTIDFLRAEVGVISSDFLPYEAQLTVLSKVFSLQKDPLTPEQRAALRGWFWLSSFHERYRGASDSVLDGDIERCVPFLAGGGPLIALRKIEEEDLKGREFRKGTAITHAFIALLATCSPLGLLDGAPIDVEGSLAWENQREFHHIFPKGYLATCSEELRKRHSDIANIMLLPSGPNKQISSEKPSVYMARLKEQHGLAALDEILATNLIPPLEDSGLLLDDFDYFLAFRLELIMDKINELASFAIAVGRDTKAT
jgi:hypothetical protein